MKTFLALFPWLLIYYLTFAQAQRNIYGQAAISSFFVFSIHIQSSSPDCFNDRI